MFTNKANLYVFDSDNTGMQDSLAVFSITAETSEKSLWLNKTIHFARLQMPCYICEMSLGKLR